MRTTHFLTFRIAVKLCLNIDRPLTNINAVLPNQKRSEYFQKSSMVIGSGTSICIKKKEKKKERERKTYIIFKQLTSKQTVMVANNKYENIEMDSYDDKNELSMKHKKRKIF